MATKPLSPPPYQSTAPNTELCILLVHFTHKVNGLMAKEVMSEQLLSDAERASLRDYSQSLKVVLDELLIRRRI